MSGRDPEAIESQIRTTQADIDATIDAIRAKVSPSQMLDQAFGFLKSEGGEMGHNALRRIKANPLPLAVIASGLAWMMATNPKAEDHSASGDSDWHSAPDYAHHRDALSLHERASGMLNDVKQKAGETIEAFNHRLHEARASALGLTRAVGEEMHSFKTRVEKTFSDLGGRASAARDALKSYARSAGNRTAKAGHLLKDSSQRIESRAEEFFQAQPLLAGVVGMAVGAIIGALVPSTRRENELLGSTGEAVRKQAAHIAEDAVDAVGRAASNVADTVTHLADEEGLSAASLSDQGDKVASRVGRLAEGVIDAVKGEAERTIRGHPS